MITDRMAEAINDQINAELYSAYLYKSMAAYAADSGLAGATNWLDVQAKEEATHAERFITYMMRVGARVKYAAIEEPPNDFDSTTHIFEEVLVHERKVTSKINKLVDIARDESDHATEIMLQWFVNEQVEEEETAQDILDTLKLAGQHGLFMVDKELGARVFAAPTISEA